MGPIKPARAGMSAWKNPPNCRCLRTVEEPRLGLAVARSLLLYRLSRRLCAGFKEIFPCKICLQQSRMQSMQDLSIFFIKLFLCFLGKTDKVFISFLLRAKRDILIIMNSASLCILLNMNILFHIDIIIFIRKNLSSHTVCVFCTLKEIKHKIGMWIFSCI